MRRLAYALPVVCLVAGYLVSGTVPGEKPSPAPVPERAAATATPPVAAPPPPPAAAVLLEAGEGSIAGRVVTRDRLPLEGVVVVAFRNAPRPRVWPPQDPGPLDAAGPPDPDREFRETLARIEADHRHRAATRREAVSGRDGTFEISGLADEYWGLLAFRNGYRIRSADDRYGARPGQEVVLVAEPVVYLPVQVLEPDGSLPERASVSLTGDVRDTLEWTPERPSIEVVPGRIRVRATSYDEGRQSDSVTVEVGTDAVPEPVVLRLEGFRGLRGTVGFPPGIEPFFHAVVALELPAGADPDPQRLTKEGVKDTLNFGRRKYEFEDLEPGRYLLGVVRREEVLASRVVTVGEGVTQVDFAIPGPDRPTEGALVRVLAPDGRPAVWAQVDLVIREERGGERRAGTAEHLDGGVFRLTPSGRAGPGETFLLRAREKEYGRREVAFDPDAGGEIELRFEEPATLTVRLAGYAGSRYEGRTKVFLGPPGNLARPGARGTAPEPDGSQTFGPLAPGDREVTVWFGMGFSPCVREPIALVSGPQELVLALPEIYTLTVRVDGPEAARGFYLERLDGPASAGSPTPYENGAIRFEGLEAGWYLLSRHAGPREHMPVTVDGDVTTRFEPVLFDARWVVISDPSGTLARSGLRTDDLVVAIDGEEITGETQGYALQRAAQAKGAATFTVLRGGKRIDFDVDLTDLSDPAKAGGSLRAWFR